MDRDDHGHSAEAIYAAQGAGQAGPLGLGPPRSPPPLASTRETAGGSILESLKSPWHRLTKQFMPRPPQYPRLSRSRGEIRADYGAPLSPADFVRVTNCVRFNVVLKRPERTQVSIGGAPPAAARVRCPSFGTVRRAHRRMGPVFGEPQVQTRADPAILPLLAVRAGARSSRSCRVVAASQPT